MNVFTHEGKKVKIKHFQYNWNSFALLTNIQVQVPNLLIEIEGPGIHNFVPAHSLDLQNFRAISLINI